MQTIHNIVRQAEDDYVSGVAKTSKYVNHSLNDTLDTIDAYLNSTHTSGETDALGREKPFFDIVTAAANVWFRATDLDRSNIKVRATKSSDVVNSFIATVMLQEWMRRERFGVFLNEWGRTLSRYGSAMVKTTRNSSGLHITVVPWNRLIVDQIDADAAPKIEIIELSESQLRQRVNTHGYDEDVVEGLIQARSARENKDKTKKDNVDNYIKLYELHGMLSKSHLTGKESDEDKYVQQMHVVSYVETKKGRKSEYEDFCLIKGEEDKDPYKLTHLIKEDGRTLSIGAVEHLFQAQWMQNHSVKAMKDQLDLAGKLIFQTADTNFAGANVISDIEQGDIFVHGMNMPLTQVNNQSHDLTSWQNFAVQWKELGNEINGISDAMLGATPKSGTAWRQTEALLTESHSLFEIMQENKGLDVEDMLRESIIPYIKDKLLDNTDEIVAILEMNDLRFIDSKYIKAEATKSHNKESIQQMLNGEVPTSSLDTHAEAVKSQLADSGNTRFLKPSDLKDKTWREQLKDLEWELEVDITGEPKNTAEAMATLNTALQVAANPQFAQNKTAQTIVTKILELTGTMSALEIASMPIESPVASGSSNLQDLNQINNATGNTIS